jgi:NAD(P) transhydrogenase
MSHWHDLDFLVVGSGPAGQKAAIQAAKLGHRAAVIERDPALGGVSTNSGTIPSKTLRAAVVDLVGLAQRPVYGDAYRVKDEITLEDLVWRTERVVEHERDVVRDQLRRNGVRVISGTASFVDPHTLQISSEKGSATLSAHRILIAVGTRPARPAGVDFDDRTVVDSDGLAGLGRIPATLTVVGGGIIGLEYASIATALGIRVTLVDKRDSLLEFVDREIVETLQYHLRGLGMTLRLGEEVSAVERSADGVVTHLASGKQIPSEVVLYTAGRQGAVEGLRLDAAGIEADARGRIAVDSVGRTAQPHIFAAGDVIGFPGLAATSMEQGRIAACAAFGVEARPLSTLIPYGVYAIPEISMIGRTEQELTAGGVPYLAGVARYRELARGQMAGDDMGLLKLLVNLETRELEGVHILGTAATELVHIGQTVIAAGFGLDYLVDAIFNYPTFADAYKIAALDAMNRLNELARGVPGQRRAA